MLVVGAYVFCDPGRSFFVSGISALNQKDKEGKIGRLLCSVFPDACTDAPAHVQTWGSKGSGQGDRAILYLASKGGVLHVMNGVHSACSVSFASGSIVYTIRQLEQSPVTSLLRSDHESNIR